MKIEKIKNYNQKILAVLATIGVIFLTVALISMISISIQEHRRFNDYDEVETGILSEEKIEQLQKENKREQVISFETPKLIDTLNSVYVIPVSHKNLNEKEDIDALGLLNSYSGPDSGYDQIDDRYSSRVYGAFNNLIIYDQKSEKNNKLFDQRVNFKNFDVEYFSDDILLIFKVAEKDTYRDGVINLLDFKSLYVYSFNEKKLKKIESQKMDVFSYKFLNNSKDLIIRFGIDKNNDGKYENHNEPTIIKKYSFETERLTDIILEKTSSDLQKMLEGTMN